MTLPMPRNIRGISARSAISMRISGKSTDQEVISGDHPLAMHGGA